MADKDLTHHEQEAETAGAREVELHGHAVQLLTSVLLDHLTADHWGRRAWSRIQSVRQRGPLDVASSL